MSDEIENTGEERSWRSEEGRVLVGLGLIAVAVAYRDSLPQTFPFPLPTPTPHLQVFTFPVFNSSVLFFSIYAACMGIYFSADISGLTYFWRKLSQRIGHAFLLGYVFTLFWSLVTTLGWLLVPSALIIPYSIVYYLSLIYLFVLIYDIVTDQWGRTNRLISRRADSIYEASKPYLMIKIAIVWKKYHNMLPRTLQDRVTRLGYYLGWGHTFHWRFRRGYVVMTPVLIVSFFVARQVEISQGVSQELATLEALITLFVGLLFHNVGHGPHLSGDGVLGNTIILSKTRGPDAMAPRARDNYGLYSDVEAQGNKMEGLPRPGRYGRVVLLVSKNRELLMRINTFQNFGAGLNP